MEVEHYLRKAAVNFREIVRSDLPRLGGGWVSAFFLVGLLVPFRNPTLSRLRIYLLLSMLTLIVVQAAARTQLSKDSPDVNGENLLVLAAPLVFVYGVAMYLVLLDQIEFPFPQARFFINISVLVVACSSLILTLLPPRSLPFAYPPYWPPLIQEISGYLKERELMMSDMPWAVGWYGRRSCIWSVLDVERDFYAINDFQKPVQGLYLTQLTSDARFYSGMVKSPDRGWEWFTVQSLVRTNLPQGFPLRHATPLPDGQLFLTDRARWGPSNR